MGLFPATQGASDEEPLVLGNIRLKWFLKPNSSQISKSQCLGSFPSSVGSSSRNLEPLDYKPLRQLSTLLPCPIQSLKGLRPLPGRTARPLQRLSRPDWGGPARLREQSPLLHLFPKRPGKYTSTPGNLASLLESLLIHTLPYFSGFRKQLLPLGLRVPGHTLRLSLPTLRASSLTLNSTRETKPPPRWN